MSMYCREWNCCGSVTETDAWEPESCPFCNPLEAAAPDLLCALQSLLKLASENLPLEECEEYEQAHAAIQKATGESS